MSDELRFVFDVNVIVSAALFSQSTPAQALFRAADLGVLLISQPLVEQLDDVLRRQRFDRFVTVDERERFLAALIQEGMLVEITQTIQACRDASDDCILELAVSGNAAAIVTGDQDLLILNPFRQIPVVTPAEFLHRFPAPS